MHICICNHMYGHTRVCTGLSWMSGIFLTALHCSLSYPNPELTLISPASPLPDPPVPWGAGLLGLLPCLRAVAKVLFTHRTSCLTTVLSPALSVRSTYDRLCTAKKSQNKSNPKTTRQLYEELHMNQSNLGLRLPGRTSDLTLTESLTQAAGNTC